MIQRAVTRNIPCGLLLELRDSIVALIEMSADKHQSRLNARDPRLRRHRLGLFLHWGLYSITAWHEQDQWRRKWKRPDYAELAARFTARKFCAHHWLDVAQELGATYVCLTAKHADGFCLWDTGATDFKSTNAPLGRDVVAELAEACSQRGVALCIYYSIVDEHHPAYPHRGGRWEYPCPLPGDRPSRSNYLSYLREQVTELCTRYGKIHAFWWDANPQKWRDPSINALIRKLQPGILINDRGMDAGDFGTPERDWDTSVDTLTKFTQATEACQALGSQSWGYRREEDYYTELHLIRSMAKILGKGGNYLLNTGPKADGRIAAEDQRLLRQIGKWRSLTQEAFDETEPVSDLFSGREMLVTRRDALTYYIILHQPPATRCVQLKPLVSLPQAAVELTSAQNIKVRNDSLPWDHETGIGFLRLFQLPRRVLMETVPVIKLTFSTPPQFRQSPAGESRHEP